MTLPFISSIFSEYEGFSQAGPSLSDAFSPRIRTAPELSEVTAKALWRLFENGDAKALAKRIFQLARSHHRVLQAFSGHPFEDDWLDFAHESLRAHVARCTGFVYAAANPVHMNIYKVGQTGTTVEERLKALVNEGVFGHFEHVHAVRVPDRFYAEAQVHQRLALKVQRHKEFFKTSHALVIQVMDAVQLEEQLLLKSMGLDAVA